jgi:pimeloyl-ACP methyl ester carboxylesterase
VVSRGHLLIGSRVSSIINQPCTEDRWSFVASQGSDIEIELMAHGLSRVELAVSRLGEPVWTSPLATVTAPGGMSPETVVFEPPSSGEYLLAVRTIVAEESETYDVGLSCLAGCELKSTRYPIVLVHGWTGFDQIGPLTYFYDVAATLEEAGFDVHIPVLDPYNSVEVRSVQLALQIQDILEQAHARKVNIIAHSQGGLDSRRAVSTLGFGDRISALVTIATPHQGTPIADIALGYLPGPGQDALFFLLEYLGAVGADSRSDAEASFHSLSEHYVQTTFNPENPDDPRVDYISWTGRTCPLGIQCGDICDVEIRWSYDLIYLQAGANDGMVPVTSGQWGDYRGEIPADHFDEVGQLAGVTGPNFDHRQFYLDIARHLATYGH